VVKTIFENKKTLVATHRIAEFFSPKTSAEASPIPIHPGAMRYFREVGAAK
jgi:TRAP-type uncharacterized transport system substrate-binding protein